MSAADQDQDQDQDQRTGGRVSGLTLLREDLNQFTEGVLKVFKDKDLNFKPIRSVEKPTNPLSLLREDLNSLREDLSGVFRTAPSREDGSEPPKGLFRRSFLKTPKPEPESRKTLPLRNDDPAEDGPTECFPETKEETKNQVEEEKEEEGPRPEENQPDPNGSQETTESLKSSSETRRNEETVPATTAANQGPEGGRDLEESSQVSEDGPSQSLCWETLSSGINLFSLTGRDQTRHRPGGDVWSLKNFACYLTLDPNSANAELRLSDGNRTATRVWLDHRSSGHPDRFERCPQVLCREGLLDSVYWEVVWSGGADVGVAYNSICRDGDAANVLLGHSERSWSMECSEGRYTPCHNRRRFRSCCPQPFSHRVGVYLDWTAGDLSFYCVSRDAMTHLHTFSAAFTEPLYPGFWVWAYEGSVSLHQVELDWERLLQ